MGVKPYAIFLDEFLFMNVKAFPSIFPTGATGAPMIMTSSMSANGASSAMKILDAKYDDGTNVVRKYNLVQSCVECKRKGIPEKCTHFVTPPQHFQNFASQARLAKMLGPLDGAFGREFMNQTDEPPSIPAFASEWIDNMSNNSAKIRTDKKHLFITIDPSAGKNGNYYVICSMVFDSDGRCTVCSDENRYSSSHRSTHN